MSDLEHLPQAECARAFETLCRLADGEAAAEEQAWLAEHLAACAKCRAAAAGFSEIDGRLTAWGQGLDREHPAPEGVRERLAARLEPLAARPWTLGWMPAAAAATIAAALALAIVAPPRKPATAPVRPPAASGEAARPFVDIPYLPPLDPHENATIVRMNIQVATLLAVGFRVTADPDAIVAAEVLVGEDGRAHAVRVLSGIDWNLTGD